MATDRARPDSLRTRMLRGEAGGSRWQMAVRSPAAPLVGSMRETGRFREPCYWAGFGLQGDWR